MTKEELIKELKRLQDWWINDASYRAPETGLYHYAVGRIHGLAEMIALVERLDDSTQGS
jgi:hypothetical protein